MHSSMMRWASLRSTRVDAQQPVALVEDELGSIVSKSIAPALLAGLEQGAKELVESCSRGSRPLGARRLAWDSRAPRRPPYT